MCGPQARLRTFPVNDRLGTRGDEMILIKRRGQKGGIQVSLDGAHSAGTVVPALRERLFHAPPATMAELTQLAPARGNFDQDAARACNGALQLFDKHPWGSQPDAINLSRGVASSARLQNRA